MEEQELAERCKQADNRARKELYEKYANRFFGLCFRYMGNYETAQDVMHDGFIKIFQSINLFVWRGQGSLRAWMERVIVNEALMQLRKAGNRNQVSIDETYEVYDMPETETVDRIPEKVLMQFISELPDGYRTVFNLYAFEGKSHKEIAHLLNINEKSSSSQLYRAKQVLVKKINEWESING